MLNRRLSLAFAVAVMVLSFKGLAFGVQVPYSVDFRGVAEKKILENLEEVSQLVQLKGSPPSTLAALRQRGEGDIPLLTQTMRAYAYYNARVTLDYAPQADGHVKVLIWVEAGMRYPLEEFKIIPVDLEEGFTCPPGQISAAPFLDKLSLSDLNICLGEPATAWSILGAQECLEALLLDAGYALAHVEEREVIVDQKTQSVRVLIRLVTGPRLRFGSCRIRGLCTVLPEFVINRVAWKKGEWFDPKKLVRTRDALEVCGLFSSIRVETLPEVTPDCHVNMLLDLSEARHRTVGAGFDYNTSEGFGLSMEWERRNIRGLGETFSTYLDLNQKRQASQLVYSKPDFFRRDQTFTWVGEAVQETTKGFKKQGVTCSVYLDRVIGEYFSYSAGTQAEFLRLTQSPRDGNVALMKFPLHFHYNTANSLLDPTCGQHWAFDFTPTLPVLGDSERYIIALLTISGYVPFLGSSSLNLAGRLTLGSVIGGSVATIPSPDLFVAGSDSLLRGYHYKSVSPLDAESKPTGGQSMIILSTELRYRATESLGGVAFFELGNVYKEMYPDFDEKLLASVGVGLRYHTPVGPLRLDIALPLNRRLGHTESVPFVDEPLQYYISIGQAF